MNIDISKLVNKLLDEAVHHREQATTHQEDDSVWIARTSASHVLISLAAVLNCGAFNAETPNVLPRDPPQE